MSTPGGQAPEQSEEVKRELRGWHLATESARRYNRNLLQYAAAAAAFMGIGAGSGGVFAVAGALVKLEDSSQSLPEWAIAILFGVGGITALGFLFFSILLMYAFSQRGQAERRSDGHLAELIALMPGRFLPKQE